MDVNPEVDIADQIDLTIDTKKLILKAESRKEAKNIKKHLKTLVDEAKKKAIHDLVAKQNQELTANDNQYRDNLKKEFNKYDRFINENPELLEEFGTGRDEYVKKRNHRVSLLDPNLSQEDRERLAVERIQGQWRAKKKF